MKYGKALIKVIELSDPEWGPFWINYKFMKKKINDIVAKQDGREADPTRKSNPAIIKKNACEVEFFRLLKNEVKKTSDFFVSVETAYEIRKARVWEAFAMLQDEEVIYEENTWTRLLSACVQFYKDVLLLENFAIMNYCGFSKILKKHDKVTGFATREAFMRNVVSPQNFTHYPNVLRLIKESEKLYSDIQAMERVMPLRDEQRLFIEAMRDLNYQAGKLHEEERILTETNTATVGAEASSPLTKEDDDEASQGEGDIDGGSQDGERRTKRKGSGIKKRSLDSDGEGEEGAWFEPFEQASSAVIGKGGSFICKYITPQHT